MFDLHLLFRFHVLTSYVILKSIHGCTECVEGPELGHGAFSVVREVSEVFLTDSEKTEDEECYNSSSAIGRPSLLGVGSGFDSTRVIIDVRVRNFISSTVKGGTGLLDMPSRSYLQQPDRSDHLKRKTNEQHLQAGS